MAEDKNINLMPEDLRKKEDLIKKSNWSFVPDLSNPTNTKNKGLQASKPSGSNPSIFSKLFSSLKPVPKVKSVPSLPPIGQTKPKLESAPTAEIKSPIFVAPDIKAMEAKTIPPATKKVEEHIQDFVSTKKVKPAKIKSTGPSWWSKLFASLKPVPKVKPVTIPVPISPEVKPKPEPPVIPTIKSPIYTAPIIKPIPVQTQKPFVKTEEHIQDLLNDKKIKDQKPSGPSWWQRFLNFFKAKPRAPKPVKQKAAVLTQAIKRNDYKVETASLEMHKPVENLSNGPKQDFKDLNKKVEDILEPKAKIEVVSKAPEEAEIILPKTEAKPVELQAESMPDFTIPKLTPIPEKVIKTPDNQVANNKFHQPEFLQKGGLVGQIGNVDLIPQAAKMRSWRQLNSLLLLAGVASLIVVGVFYGSLFLQEQAIIKEQKLQQTAMLEIEKEILNFNKLNEDIKLLGEEINLVQEALNKHIYWTQFFALLEKYTLPEVYYGGISAGNGGALTLSATTNSYEAVARQLKVFQQEQAQEFVKSVNISAANAGSGKVSFSISLVLNPDLFYYDK